MSSILRKSELVDLCAPSIGYDAQVKSACKAFDPQMYSIIDDTGQVIMITNIMGINDENLIDILAWQFHVDFYDKTRDLEFRKRLVQMSIVWHKTKGTMALVQEVINTYWPGTAYLQEWYEYMIPLPPPQPPTNWSGPLPAPSWHDRYRFRVIVDNTVVDPDTEAQVVNLIYRYKPISRWPDTTPIIRPRSATGYAYATGYATSFIHRQSTQVPAPLAKQLVTTGLDPTPYDLITGDDGNYVRVGP
jgi:P2-related tail formation protein